MNTIRICWRPFLFFTIYFVILFICVGNDLSAKCYGNDSYSLLYGAQFMEIKYPSPMFTILGYPFANLPFGATGHNLTLFMSAIPALVTSVMVFLIVKKKTMETMAPYVGSATVMGSYILFSQSVIIEVYVLLAMFISISYCLLVYDKPKLSAFVCGMTMTTHIVTGIPYFIAMFLTSSSFRRNWYIVLIVFATIVVVYNRFVPIFYWDIGCRNTVYGAFEQTMNSFGMGGNSSEMWQGLWNTIKILIVGFGLSLIPILLFVYKDFAKAAPYVFLIGAPVVFMIVGNWPYRFVQLVPYVSFAAIMAGLGVQYLKTKYLDKIIFVSLMAMTLSMPLFFDIGNTLDENPTTYSQLYSSLNEVEDESIIACLKMFEIENEWISDTIGNHIAGVVEKYNRENDTDLIPFMFGFVWDKEHVNKNRLVENGIVIPDFEKLNEQLTEETVYMYILNELALVNPDRDVYWYRIVDNKTERCELVKIDL